MTNESKWLESLQAATSYADLQRVFSELATDASQSSKPSELVGSIDEAIRRLELEKARDTAELEQFTEQYDAFKQEQSGVLGWLKRKLPFTETRKQELGHRDAVNDLAAETMADCFVIARVEMLKERLLPEDKRRMGHYPNAWRDRLLQNESGDRIREFASVVRELGNELDGSRAFLETLRTAIDVFSGAKFSDKEDRSRRDADVAAARAEEKQLESENREKVALRKTSLKRLAELIHEELTNRDPAFRTLSKNTDQVQSIAEELKTLCECNALRQSAIVKLVENVERFEAIPDRRQLLEDSIRTLRQHYEDAERLRVRAANDKELEGIQDVEGLRRKIEQQSNELNGLSDQERQFRHAVAESHDHLQRVDRDFIERTRRYTKNLATLPPLDSLRSLIGIPSDERDSSLFEDRATGEILPSSPAWGNIPTLPGKSSSMIELERRQSIAQQFSEAFQSDLKMLQRVRNELAEARIAALKERCTMLVNDELAKEIDFE